MKIDISIIELFRSALALQDIKILQLENALNDGSIKPEELGQLQHLYAFKRTIQSNIELYEDAFKGLSIQQEIEDEKLSELMRADLARNSETGVGGFFSALLLFAFAMKSKTNKEKQDVKDIITAELFDG